MPELQVVKISDDGLYQMPLKELKKRPLSTDPNETPPAPVTNKRWKKAVKQESPEKSDALQSTVETEDSPSKPITNSRAEKRGKPQKQADFRQSSNKAVNFDYSQANYQRFQGGSGNQQTQQGNIIQKFKGGKNKKANLDKMFSFSNFRLNKRK